MAGAVKQVASLRRIEVEEYARHDCTHVSITNRRVFLDNGLRQTHALTYDLLLQALLEEVQSIVDFLGQTPQIQPNIERRIRDELDVKADLLQTAKDVIALVAEVPLERFHLLEHLVGLEHRNRRFLEGYVGSSVKVRAAGTDSADEGFGSNDPGDTLKGGQLKLLEWFGDFITHPGRRKRLVRPSIKITSSSFTSMMLSAADTVVPSQSLV